MELRAWHTKPVRENRELSRGQCPDGRRVAERRSSQKARPGGSGCLGDPDHARHRGGLAGKPAAEGSGYAASLVPAERDVACTARRSTARRRGEIEAPTEEPCRAVEQEERTGRRRSRDRVDAGLVQTVEPVRQTVRDDSRFVALRPRDRVDGVGVLDVGSYRSSARALRFLVHSRCRRALLSRPTRLDVAYVGLRVLRLLLVEHCAVGRVEPEVAESEPMRRG